MASTFLWAGLAALVIALLFLIAIVQNSVDDKSIIPTPSIPREHAIMTSVSSIKIKASVDDVFAVVASFKDYSPGTPFSTFNWKNKTADGVPMVGSTGTFRVRFSIVPSVWAQCSLANRILVEHRGVRVLTQSEGRTDPLGP